MQKNSKSQPDASARERGTESTVIIPSLTLRVNQHAEIERMRERGNRSAWHSVTAKLLQGVIGRDRC